MKEKVYGLNIASLVLGIVSLVLWCVWFISIPCAILALVFGIIGVKKVGKGMAIAGIVTSAIGIAIWIFVFVFAFMAGFITAFAEELDLDDIDSSSSNYLDYDYDYEYEE